MNRRDLILSTLATAAVSACGRENVHNAAKPQIYKDNKYNKQAMILDKLIENYIDDGTVVGAVVMIAKGGKTIFQKAGGFYNREKKTKLRPDDSFRYSSLSKVFTHCAILRLMDKGQISPDDSVTKYLPYFTPKLKDSSTPKITISHLLTHTAALDYDFNQPEFGDYYKAGISCGLDDSKISLEEDLKRIAKVPLDYPPGKNWRYSMSSDVLGAVIEKITNKPLQTAIDDLVCIPLALVSPAFSAPNGTIVDAYYATADKPKPMKGRLNLRMSDTVIRFDSNRIYDRNAFASGGAGMCGNAPDFLKLLEAIRNPNFISPVTMQKALNANIGNKSDFDEGWGFSYLFSTLISPQEAKTNFGENTLRWGGVYGHSWLMDFKNELSLVILTNTAYEGMSGQFKQDIFKFVDENLIL